MIAHRSGTSRKVAALLAVLVAALCVSPSLAPADGTGDAPPDVPTVAPADTPAAPTAALPQGKLTAAEYKALLRSDRYSKRFEKAKSTKKAMSLMKASCAELRKVDTPLLVSLGDQCDALVGWVSSYLAFVTDVAHCAPDQAADPTACLADMAAKLASTSDQVVHTARAMNREVRQRSLPRACSRQMTTPQRDLRDLEHVARDAHAFEAALRAGDKKAIARTSKRLDKSLSSETSGNDSGSLKRRPHAGR